MKFTNLEYLGNPYVREVVEINHVAFEGILNQDRPIGQIIEDVKDKFYSELFDEKQLLCFVKEVNANSNLSLKTKMERIILDEINALVFSDISISIYNLKCTLGLDKGFEVIRSVILDPINWGNPMIISIALKMEEKRCLV